MKKLLLSAVAFGLLTISQVSAQCTPGNIATDFQPAIGTTIPSGAIGSQYNQTILFKAPAQLTVSASDLTLPAPLNTFAALLPASFSVQVNSMNVNGISGQPAGLTGTANGSGTYNAGQQGCLQIAGIPTEGGNFTVTLDVEYSVTVDASALGLPIGGTFAIPTPVPSPQARTYNMSVPTSIEELTGNTFNAIVAPNPFDVATNIIYTNPQQGNVDLSVYNMLGKLVYSNTYEAKAGKNTIALNAVNMASGMYIYNLSNGKEVRTGKMTVSK